MLRGRDLVAQLTTLPEDIAQICLLHHQIPSAASPQIHPLARFIGSIDCFIEQILPLSVEGVAHSPQQALRWIHESASSFVENEYLEILDQVFGQVGGEVTKSA